MKYDKLCRYLGALSQGEDPFAFAPPFLNISPTEKLETFCKAHPASFLSLTIVKQLSPGSGLGLQTQCCRTAL